MRDHVWRTGWTCAVIVAIASPIAFAERASRSKGSLSACTAFGQRDKTEEAVEFTITNSCTVPVDCAIRWRLVCAPDSKKRRAVHPGEAKLALANGSSLSAEASAERCGDDAWAIDAIEWRCEPNHE